ncbi:MAG: signal peptidase I [Lachnospiraceae bacterium]|nr:signal peptidase I [Lachnospiraceae bacterium]
MKKKRHPFSGAFRILSTLLLTGLVLFCLPLTLPRLFGYHIYSVISGSMEPAIPVGSLLYIEETGPEELQEGEVIAFYGARDSAAIITHRVLENRVVMGELITKGDANQQADMNPIPYGNVIGRVTRAIPKAGKAAELFTSREGKLLAAALIGVAVLLQLLAALLENKSNEFK